MKTVKGIYAEAKIFTDDVEDYAEAQVKMICDNEVAEGSVHPSDAGYPSRQSGPHRTFHDGNG